MKRRPVIGITVDTTDGGRSYESPFGYARSVEAAGGVPLLFPYRCLNLVSTYVDAIDGMLFSGGNDLDPAAWGEAYHPGTKPVDPDRERFERVLLAEVERRRVPTLGICFGSQLMNVHRGGTLHQFLPELPRPEPLEHRMLDRSKEQRHPVRLHADATVAQLLGKTETLANSSHKQSVRTVGRGLRIIGTAPDGVVEGVEDPTFPLFLGVQWHPERISDEPDHARLFGLLVEKALGYR